MSGLGPEANSDEFFCTASLTPPELLAMRPSSGRSRIGSDSDPASASSCPEIQVLSPGPSLARAAASAVSVAASFLLWAAVSVVNLARASGEVTTFELVSSPLL